MAKAAILLVEDDAHDVELLQLAFTHAGSPFALVSVSDGGEAVKYLAREGQYSNRENYPDPFLVLLDLAMPVMDGFDVLRWMQNQKTVNLPPVFVFSYSRIEKEMQLADKLGAKLFLSKPVDLDGAIALVKQLEGLSQKAADPNVRLPLIAPEV
jgi:CheY-like chemotaxis protein